MTLFAVVLIVSVGLFWILQTVKDARTQYGEIREKYLDEQKGLIKKETDQVVSYIQQEKSLTEKRLKTAIQGRTEEAYQTALYIYEENRQTKSLMEIKKMVHDALYAASWDEGRGYYFAFDMQGVGIVNRNRPELEGADLISLQDDQGVFFVRDFIAAARSNEKAGFCSYNWTKPEAPGVYTRKISHVKYFPPFDWVLGAGMYFVDEEKVIQQEIFDRVEKIRYGKDGYLFIGRWDGLTLAGPAKGRNMLETTDENGIKIVQELIARAREGGGFMSYVMPALDGKQQMPKISYAAPVADWQWYVGTGVYVDAIEDIIRAKQQVLHQSVKAFVIKSVLVLVLFLFLSLALSLFLSGRIRGNLQAFSDFFNQTEKNDQLIAEDGIAFQEFHSMAVAANRMADERRKAWVALEESEQRFHQVIDAAHIPLIIIDHDSHVRLTNRKFIALFGYSALELVALNNWWELACPEPESRARISGRWDVAMAASERSGEPVVDFIVQACCADQSIRTIEMGISQVGVWRLITFQDLTDQLKAEEEKKILETKLVQAQKMEAIGLLAGGVAHDLNNILSGIVSYPELLLMQLPLDSKLRTSIQAIHESGRRAAEVVADLLTIARGVAATREVLSLNGLIRDFLVSPECQRILKVHPGVRFITGLDPGLWRIHCSSIHIRKILLNLVLNAAEAISGAGTVTLSTKNRNVDGLTANGQGLNVGEYVQLMVRDTGSGISPQDLGRIFEPFYTKKVMGKSGTGLGLAVVWNTIQEHGGAIAVESSGAGTCFTLLLPAARGEKAPLPQGDDIGSYRGGGETILVVDDEAQQRDIAGSYLTCLGYRVETVESGEKAVEYLQKQPVDLLLLDMIMDPGMSGWETYERISRIRPGQKAVIASGFAETDEVRKALAIGGGVFIKKPYTFQQIAGAVARALGENGGGTPGVS